MWIVESTLEGTTSRMSTWIFLMVTFLATYLRMLIIKEEEEDEAKEIKKDIYIFL